MPSQCKSVCIPQFTPWFETRCTVDIDGYNNFRYPLCMGKLSYLKQKDDTPLITISTAEDDETMNGRKAVWTQGSSSNVYSTLGYGNEKVSVTSQKCHNIPSRVLLACHAVETPRERSGVDTLPQRNLDNLVSKVQCQRKFFMWSVKNVANKSLEIEMRGKVNLFKFG